MKSLRVERALKKIGADIRDARKRRRITLELMAQRVGITRVTVSKIEKGDPKVSMGNYALVLYVLGRIEALENIIDRTQDPLGLDLMDERLPKRVRVPR